MGCKPTPNLICIDLPDADRHDPAVCADQLGARCDTLGSPPTCKLPCHADTDCGGQGLGQPPWLCIDGLCTDCRQDQARCLCHRHSDCLSKVCDVYDSIDHRPADSPAQPADRAGRCIARDLVLYVDNSSVGCVAGGNHSGRADDPFCSLSEALMIDSSKLPGRASKRIIRVLGSSKSYGPVSFARTSIAEPVFLFGPGQRHDSDPAAKLSALAPPISQSGAFSLTVDGFYLEWLDSTDLMTCSTQQAGQTPEVTIRRSYVTSDRSSNHQIAMTMNGCKLTLDSDWFDGIVGWGVLSMDQQSQTQITNTYFTGNENSVGAMNNASLISIKMPANQFLFSYNTLAGNQPSSGQYVVNCFQCSVPLDYSILEGPSSSLVRGAIVTTSAVGAPGAILDATSLDATQPKYRLLATPDSCCVNTAEAAPPVHWDYFGNHRPLLGSSTTMSVPYADKGAEELLPAK